MVKTSQLLSNGMKQRKLRQKQLSIWRNLVVFLFFEVILKIDYIASDAIHQ